MQYLPVPLEFIRVELPFFEIQSRSTRTRTHYLPNRRFIQLNFLYKSRLNLYFAKWLDLKLCRVCQHPSSVSETNPSANGQNPAWPATPD